MTRKLSELSPAEHDAVVARAVEAFQTELDQNAAAIGAILSEPITPNAWDTAELQRDFEVHAFQAPFVLVTRKSDGVKGTLEFTHRPRVYFDFQASE